MNTISTKLQRIAIAGAFAAGIISAGVAASAQTAGPAVPTTTTDGTNVSISTTSIDSKAQRQAHLDEINAEERRVEFRHLGTSL